MPFDAFIVSQHRKPQGLTLAIFDTGIHYAALLFFGYSKYARCHSLSVCLRLFIIIFADATTFTVISTGDCWMVQSQCCQHTSEFRPILINTTVKM